MSFDDLHKDGMVDREAPVGSLGDGDIPSLTAPSPLPSVLVRQEFIAHMVAMGVVVPATTEEHDFFRRY